MKKVTALAIFLIVLALPHSVEAHRDGCHRWHSCPSDTGSYVCGDLAYYSECPISVPTVILPATTTPTPIAVPRTPEFPKLTAQVNQSVSADNTAYTISFHLNDPSTTQYSIAANKYAGADPGPNTDFYGNDMHLFNVKPGKWYINVKKDMGGVWSTVAYWTVDLPPIPTAAPTQKPTPTPTLSPTIEPTNSTTTSPIATPESTPKNPPINNFWLYSILRGLRSLLSHLHR